MSELISLGAVVFSKEQLKPFADAFHACYDSLGIPQDVELKWSPDSKNDWFRKNAKPELQTPLREGILDAAQACGAKAIVVVWDKAGGWETMRKDPAEKWVLHFLYERLSMMLENEEKLGVIVFDKPGGDHKAEDRWISNTTYLTRLGTEFVEANAVVLPILTAPSHHHPHLQLADLITGSVTAAIGGSKFGMSLVPKIKPMFHVNWRGNIGSTGLKLFPDSLNNLHHWVLGEDTYTRGNGGVGLPYDGFARYATNSGLAVPGSRR